MAVAATASVVIPAYQEERVIARCLRTLLAEAAVGEFAVVVVCNGCTDATADEARRAAEDLGHAVHVLELPQASKPVALRAGDASLSDFPRIYLDADALCPTATARALAAALSRDDMELAVPNRVLDLSMTSSLGRLYYRTWASLPWVDSQLAGRGAFAFSRSGRARFEAFPDVIADDRYATTRVPRERAAILKDAPVMVTPPASLRVMVRVRSRVFAGNATLDGVAHDAPASRRWAFLARQLARPAAWPGLAVFVGVTLLAKSLAWVRVRGGHVGWSRDRSRGAMA
ncbi:MAG: glycosyltransferase [Haloechinothrix sp.]